VRLTGEQNRCAVWRARITNPRNKELARRFADLEKRLERKLATHDQAIASILDAIRQLMTPPDPPKRPIGFVTLKEKKSDS